MLLEGHMGGRKPSALRKASAGTALIPLRHDMAFLPGREYGQKRRLRFARAAMQEKKGGSGPVRAADGDPLFDAADPRETFLRKERVETQPPSAAIPAPPAEHRVDAA